MRGRIMLQGGRRSRWSSAVSATTREIRQLQRRTVTYLERRHLELASAGEGFPRWML